MNDEAFFHFFLMLFLNFVKFIKENVNTFFLVDENISSLYQRIIRTIS